MPYTVDYDADQGLITVANTGVMSRAEYHDQITQCKTLADEHDVKRFLVDDLKLEPSLKLMEIYDFTDLYEKLGVDATSRIAVLARPDPAKQHKFDFYETICQNRGFSVKLFADRDAALTWLMRDQPAE